MQKGKTLSVIKDYLVISLGLLLYTLAWAVFIIPHHLVGGGVTGISAIVQYITGFNMSYTMFIINAVLLLIALRILGTSFGARTVYAIVFSSIAFRIVPELIPQEFIQQVALDNGKLLSVIFGGALSGLGCSLAITHGGSSGVILTQHSLAQYISESWSLPEMLPRQCHHILSRAFTSGDPPERSSKEFSNKP